MRLPEFWIGDEASFEEILRSYLMFIESPTPPARKLFAEDGDDDEAPLSITEYIADSMMTRDGSVGIVNVNGPLVSSADFWAALLGFAPYPSIDMALDKFVADDSVESILLNMGTSGGDSVGIDETANKIRLADASKPVYSWSGSRSLSAGYWLSAAARQIYGTRMAEHGSIGVISTHTSMARMLKDKGLDVTVVRAGKYKALGHPAEQLSDEAKKIMEEKVGKLYGFFLDHVAERRGLSMSAKDSWAEGRTFFGDEAVSAGLVDSLVSLKDTVSRLNAQSLSEERSMPKQVILSEQAAAAVASGVSLEQVPHEETELEAGDPPAVDPEVIEPPVGAAAPEAVAAEPANAEIVSYLRSELSEERKKTAELERELIEATTQLKIAEAATGALLPIAVEWTRRLMVGLGHTPLDMAGFSTDMIVLQHERARAAFDEKFKIGRQSLDSLQTQPAVKVSSADARKAGLTVKTGKSTVGTHPAWGG